MNVSSRALQLVFDALRQRRNQIHSRWRKLAVADQARMVLAHLRKGETFTDLASGFGVGTSTVYRYLHEAIALLAAMAPCYGSTGSAWPQVETGPTTAASTRPTG